MLKILQDRLQQYMNHELRDVQAGFRKCRGNRDQIANICWIIANAWEFQKNIYFCFIDYAKAFDCVDHNKVWKILKERGIKMTLPVSWETCMQDKKQELEPDVKQRTASKLGKEYVKAVYCHPVYLAYAEYIMWNARLDELQAGIKIARRTINNLRYADDITLMAQSEEKLKSLLMKMKEESEKVGLKLNFEKTKIMASSPFTSWQIDGRASSPRQSTRWGQAPSSGLPAR